MKFFRISKRRTRNLTISVRILRRRRCSRIRKVSLVVGSYSGKPNLLRKEYVDRKDASKIVQLTVLDGKYGWTYTPILNQVNKMKWTNPERRELLPGIGASLEDVQKNYDMALIPDEFANPKGVYQIELTPKIHMVSTNAKETLQIWVKSGEWLPVQFGYKTEFEDGTHQSVIVTLKQIERDKELAPKSFQICGAQRC